MKEQIVIIGAGLSGSLLAINLLRQNKHKGLKIVLTDASGTFGAGLAYNRNAHRHLLNVPAGKMSLFPEKPNHFLEWLEAEGIAANSSDFLPRSIFGKYVASELERAISETKQQSRVSLLALNATDISFGTTTKPRVLFSDGEEIEAESVVLALGNFPPAKPQADTKTLQSTNYIHNPLASNAIEFIPDGARVLILGAGLTMVDVAITLNENKANTIITAVSRHGFIPELHGPTNTYPSFYEEIKDLKTVYEMLVVFRKHLKKAGTLELGWRSVVDSIRPHTQQIWNGLDWAQKREFMKYLRHFWGVARHRMPPETGKTIHFLRQTGQLNVKAGRINKLETKENGALKAHFSHNGQKFTLEADYIINCMGPETNIANIESELLKNLMAANLIRPDVLGLGIEATVNGEITDSFGRTNNLYTLGPLLKGILWECTAVPEIRVQAQNLATLLLEKYCQD